MSCVKKLFILVALYSFSAKIVAADSPGTLKRAEGVCTLAALVAAEEAGSRGLPVNGVQRAHSFGSTRINRLHSGSRFRNLREAAGVEGRELAALNQELATAAVVDVEDVNASLGLQNGAEE